MRTPRCGRDPAASREALPLYSRRSKWPCENSQALRSRRSGVGNGQHWEVLCNQCRKQSWEQPCQQSEQKWPMSSKMAAFVARGQDGVGSWSLKAGITSGHLDSRFQAVHLPESKAPAKGNTGECPHLPSHSELVCASAI